MRRRRQLHGLAQRPALGRDQWLNGTRLDRFVTPVRRAAGMNRLLVKICQGPQHKDPEVPNNWSLIHDHVAVVDLGYQFAYVAVTRVITNQVTPALLGAFNLLVIGDLGCACADRHVHHRVAAIM